MKMNLNQDLETQIKVLLEKLNAKFSIQSKLEKVKSLASFRFSYQKVKKDKSKSVTESSNLNLKYKGNTVSISDSNLLDRNFSDLLDQFQKNRSN
jgi:hypothetical protein